MNEFGHVMGSKGSSSLADHDRTQVLHRITDASGETIREIRDDGTSFQLTAELAQFRGTVSFRRVSGEGWVGEDGYTVDVTGPAKFVSEVISDAAGRFLDSEER